MNNIAITTLLFGLVLIQGCVSHDQQAAPKSFVSKVDQSLPNIQVDSSVVWASNLGGSEYQGADGIFYMADELKSTASAGQIDLVIGAQEATIYQTYRSGDMHLQKALPNGLYDIVFRFAEPNDVPIGDRVFNVMAEGQVVIPNLDVRSARDGNARSSLDRTVMNVALSDGMLDIEFKAIAGEPLLNGIVVRAKQTTDLTQWNMVWGDEFDYTGAPNKDKWSYDIWPAQKVNGEDQAYTDRANNVRVDDGKLIIQAHKERYNEADYTSARIHSAGKGDMLYGRVEVRAKLPAGQGTWPAIWMLPTDPFKYASNCESGTDWQGNDNCNAWPNSGEIDIMEHVGYDMNRVHGTVHTQAYYWVNGNQRKASVEAQNADQAFHVYAMEWSPQRIDIFIDDICYFTYLNQAEGWQAWPFDHPYHLILNVAVGGGWGSAGGPTDILAFPATMEVDYVRLYEKTDLLTSSQINR